MPRDPHSVPPVGGADRRPRRSRRTQLFTEWMLLVAILAAALSIAAGIVALAGIGRGHENPLSSRVWSALRRRIEHRIPPLSTPALDEALEVITRRLREAAPSPVRIVVMDSPQVNAVTLPGGLIVVYSGLIRQLQTPEQFAAVVAHELGHVTARDPEKRLSRRLAVSTLLSLVAGATPQAIRRLLNALLDAGFTRVQEEAADSFALHLLADAGIDPAALPSALEQFQEQGQIPAFLRPFDDHPQLQERIALLQQFSVWRWCVDAEMAVVEARETRQPGCMQKDTD